MSDRRLGIYEPHPLIHPLELDRPNQGLKGAKPLLYNHSSVVRGKLEGALAPSETIISPSPYQGEDAVRRVKERRSLSYNHLPLPLIKGKGDKGDGVVKQSLEHTAGKLKTEEVDDDQANSCKLKG